VKNDLISNNKDIIKPKLCNSKYLYKFLIEFITLNYNLGYNRFQIKTFFQKEYGEIKMNYELLSKEEINNIIIKFNNRNKTNYKTIEEVLNLDTFILKAYTNVVSQIHIKNKFIYLFENFTDYRGNKLVTKLNVNFVRKKISYS
jgi:hypothetical protein